MNEILACPRCSTSISTQTALPNGMKMNCPCCRKAFRLLRTSFGTLECIPIVGDKVDRSAPLPVRRKQPPSQPKYVPIYESRKTLATLCIMALGTITCLFVNWYVETVKDLSATTDRAAAARLARIKQLQAQKNKGQEIQNVIIDNKPTSFRITAPAAGRVGDLVLGVESASIGPVSVHKRETSGAYLTLGLRMTNLSKATVRFPGWQRSASLVLLRDTAMMYYNRVRFPGGDYPDGCLEEVVIEPGRTVKDLLVYEVPSGFRNLELDIPYANQGFAFVIPAGLIVKVVPDAMKKPVEQTPPPPQPPLPPQYDPEVRRAVVVEYRRLWGGVQQRAKNMAYDRGRQYRRVQHAEILRSLSEKYQISEDTLNTILP